MKEQILEIITQHKFDHISSEQAVSELLDLFTVSSSFISVVRQEPPHNIELLAKSPTGTVHLTSWRPAYNIFTCQAKSESSWNWSWKLI
jgi:hypothetical protein